MEHPIQAKNEEANQPLLADNENLQDETQKMNPDLKSLEKLIGNWKWSGGMQGVSNYEWADGGFFLVHNFEFEIDGKRSKGIEIIGHERLMETSPSAEIKTHLYSFLDGLTLNYVYEAGANDFFTVWMGDKSSAAFMNGKFSDNGKTLNIEWKFPGGGFKATASKEK